MNIKFFPTKIVIYGLPIPISENKSYEPMSFVRGGKRINTLRKSNELIEFQNKVHIMSKSCLLDLVKVKQQLDKWGFIKVDRAFYFKQDRLFTKKGTAKKLDTSNRIKPLDDILAEVIGTDDSYFWSGTEEKICVNYDYEEQTVVSFEPHTPQFYGKKPKLPESFQELNTSRVALELYETLKTEVQEEEKTDEKPRKRKQKKEIPQ